MMDNEAREKLVQMVDEAIYEIKELSALKLTPHDRINWPSGLLANALIAYYKNNLNLEISLVIKQTLTKYYLRFIKSRQKFHYLDNAVAFQALIDLHQSTGEERFKVILDQMANYLKQHAVDEQGSLPYRPAQGNKQIHATAIGMICPFLCKYGFTYNDQNAKSLAIKQILNFCRNGLDTRSGLPYHGYEYKSQTKYGIIGWGQACGWLMLGMVESLIYMDREIAEYDEIKQYFRRMVDKVEAYQREDGLYTWQLPAREGPVDTSATALILLAIARGLENDILIGIHRSRLLRGRDALINMVADGKIDNCLAECGGFGVYPQKYGAYPWSLGPALSLFSVKIKEMKE